MSQDLLSIEAAAKILGLHPKTVIRFIREGRLKAAKVGRAWRITRAEVDAFAGLGEPEPRTGLTARATTIVDIDDLTTEEAQRIVNGMQAVLNGPKPRPIQIETAYDMARRSLKLVLIATPGDAGAMLSFLSNYTDT